MQALQHHKRETEKNLEAENQQVRKQLWGYTEPKASEEDMPGQTILGDVITHPTPVIMQPQSSGLGKVIAAAAVTAGMLGVPLAGIGGYLLNEYMNKKEQQTIPAPIQQDKEDVDLGLLKLSDLISPK